MFTRTIALLFFLVVTSAVPIDHGRVINGDTAEPGQFPFIVSIQVELEGGMVLQQCGASILNSQWLLTAAHCFYGFTDEFHFYVLADTTTLDSGGTIFDIDAKVLHPDYNTSIYINDIALIKLNGTLTFSDTVKTIEVGDAEDNETCTVIGWGFTENGGSNTLQYADLSTVSYDDCTTLSEGGRWIFDRIDAQICTYSDEGTAPCNGDSGGPLVCNGKLAGLVSYSVSPPCEARYPHVYTRASSYIDWIRDVIANN